MRTARRINPSLPTPTHHPPGFSNFNSLFSSLAYSPIPQSIAFPSHSLQSHVSLISLHLAAPRKRSLHRNLHTVCGLPGAARRTPLRVSGSELADPLWVFFLRWGFGLLILPLICSVDLLVVAPFNRAQCKLCSCRDLQVTLWVFGACEESVVGFWNKACVFVGS